MTLHYEDGGLRLFHGSNKDILPTFPDASFDSIVTDPPYELGFMGKGWDSSGIAYDVEVWRECFRVLKPGGYMLAFGGTRTWHRIAVAIEDAGFEIRDSIAWMYGSGFPKSVDVSKVIDKALGAERTKVRVDASQVRNPKATGGGRDGVKGASRPWIEKALEVGYHEKDSDQAATPEAQAWEGWGTALKPAFEPIIVARKPLAGTVAANVLAYGTGAINIDACRVGDGSDSQGVRSQHEASAERRYATTGAVNLAATPGPRGGSPSGRFPSNVLLDESQAAALDTQSGYMKDGVAVRRNTLGNRKSAEGRATSIGAGMVTQGPDQTYGSGGGASRFFPTFRYVAKAPGTERPEVDGVAHATVKPLDLMRWLVRLVTRRGGHVLDLFAGSGTTGEAALLEGMECTLIELEADHLPLILARVRKPLQTSLFGDWEGGAA
ncbi:DNA methyltransferase [uncultured Microbacterium sp.]|uniref:DNA-methyltransferase n=1 Tax=uncultured Microbacterium sp. TaxID=191216 RepID=UPI002600E6DA|nr:DNA methyltransferase [uncultured Microbacterium sp.]